MRPLLTLALAALALPVAAQERPRTWANPIDVDYKYNFEQTHQGISYRTGADPVIVLHRDRYYLFQTLADGFWVSDDLLVWTYVPSNRWPFESNVAPAAVSDGERLYLMQSAFEPRPLLVAERPEVDGWRWHTRLLPPVPGAVSRQEEGSFGEGGLPADRLPPGPWDPALFIDDDQRWYLYWGSSNVYPLYAAEIDPTAPVRFLGEVRKLHVLHPDRHGWERFGRDHSGGLPDGTPINPYMEGAWMTKHAGRYYLQYGAPGTEYNAYANGTYVGDGPLGPFDYAPWNPISYKPGGFVQGAGHGSTFQDRHGNWWNTGTPWLGHNWTFERRIAMFPGRFWDDGQMAFTSRFGDFPQRLPDGPVENPESLWTGWVPLSYRAAAEASSVQGEHTPDRATDEDPRTFWAAESNTPGQSLTLDLGGVKTVQAVQVNYADLKSGVYAESPSIRTRFRLWGSADGTDWRVIADLSGSERDRPNAYVQLDRPERLRFVRYEHLESPGANLALGDLRVFGNGDAPAPATPQGLTVARGEDQRNATVRFRPVDAALGYNVRWGVQPDRLTLTYQVWADDLATRGGAVEVRALNLGVDYWFAVEAFGEGGASGLAARVFAPAKSETAEQEPSPPPCDPAHARLVTFGVAREMGIAEQSACVIVEGLWSDFGLLDGVEGYYDRALSAIPDSPDRIGLYGDNEAAGEDEYGLRPVRLVGRPGHCRELYRQRPALGPNDIWFTTGYCHEISGPFIRVDRLEVLGGTPHRLTGAHHRRRRGQLTEVTANWPFRAEVERRARDWLRLLVAGDAQAYATTYEVDADLDSLFVGEDAAAMRLAEAEDPELRLWFSQENMDAADSDEEHSVVACFKIGEWAGDRWPVAELDADARPGRPYACVHLHRTVWDDEVSEFARATSAPGGLAEPVWPD